jgi:hypothetical protein
VMDLFSTEGGTNLSGMVEAFAQTPLGKAVLGKMGVAAPDGSEAARAPEPTPAAAD